MSHFVMNRFLYWCCVLQWNTVKTGHSLKRFGCCQKVFNSISRILLIKQVDNGKLSSGVLTLGKSLVMFHARSVPWQSCRHGQGDIYPVICIKCGVPACRCHHITSSPSLAVFSMSQWCTHTKGLRQSGALCVCVCVCVYRPAVFMCVCTGRLCLCVCVCTLRPSSSLKGEVLSTFSLAICSPLPFSFWSIKHLCWFRFFA